MKNLSFILVLILGFLACRPEVKEQSTQLDNDHALQLLTDDRPEWQYEHLRLYPIVASESFVADNAAAAELKTLSEAIDTYGFRISEKKPFGRFEDSGAVNNLTVQNKTSDPVFLMGGDVVQGGRQDRVVGEDQIIAARSLQDIPVFCVEQGRWNFHEEVADPEDIADRQDKVFAFSGYYHVASADIRHTLSGNKSQQEVWEKVSQLNNAHSIDSQTGAYASLEGSEEFTRRRDAYLRFFEDKFSGVENMVGIMAVSGQQIIATDVFGHPNLLQRQLGALLHSYTIDAITSGAEVSVGEKQLQRQLTRTNKALSENGVTRYEGALVHHFVKAVGK